MSITIDQTCNNKLCYNCRTEKPNEDFPIRKKKLMGVCKKCYTELYGDPKEVEEKRLKYAREAIRRKQEKHWAIAKDHMKHGCVDCGEKNIIVLEFDHRDPKEKSHNISKLYKGTTKQLKEELVKCDVVCANCHRKRTAKMFGSWRSVLVEEKLFEEN